GQAQEPHPAPAVRGPDPGRDRLPHHRPREHPRHAQGRAVQVLRRRHLPQAQAAREAEGGQEAHEEHRLGRRAAGGLHRSAVLRRRRAAEGREEEEVSIAPGPLPETAPRRLDPLELPELIGPGRIGAVCTVAQLFEVRERSLMSGIDKRPVDGPVTLLTHGVLGDVQGDREHHGGIFKAVYAYSREVREAYAEALGEELPDGFFGENLVTTGHDTDHTVIGERWRVGGAEIEATCPRNPCGTFAAWMGDRRWGRTFTAQGRAGAYFR